MSDAPEGPGWWLASDGKYYAPEQASPPPPPSSVAPTAEGSDKSGGLGWWQALDGRWYSRDAVTPDGQRCPFAKKPARSKTPVLLALGGLVAVLVLAGAGWLLFKPASEPTVAGPDAIGLEFSLISFDAEDFYGTNGDCSGSGGYRDFGEGMDITVTNQDGKIIGSGNTRGLDDLSAMEPEFYETLGSIGDDFDLDADSSVGCVVGALVPISESAEFYDVEVGKRGSTSYSQKDMEEQDWMLSLSLS